MAKLVFLGKFADMAAMDSADVTLPGEVKTLADLQPWLARERPLLGRALATAPIRLVLNHGVAHDLQVRICDADEIAFLPPMSGG
jgi:molybdopterin converting factor small subunit